VTRDYEDTPKVFISYKWQDEERNEWVRRFCDDLRTRYGVDARLDVYEVQYGESFSDYMTSRIDRDCGVMLLVITPAAVEAVDQSKTGGIHFEMQIANARRLREPGFRIIGIYREGKENTAYLHDHRYIDFRDETKYEERLKELADSLWHRSHRPALGRIGNTGAAEPFVAALQDEDPGVRRAAAEALREIGDERAVEPLIAALRDEDMSVREAATDVLGAIGAERAVAALIVALEDENWDTRTLAAQALGQTADERAIQPLIAALGDEYWGMRAIAAQALGGIGDQRAVEPLIAMLQDKDEHSWARQGAAQALGTIGDARAVQLLIAALEDEDRALRSSADRALQHFDTAEARKAVEEHREQSEDEEE